MRDSVSCPKCWHSFLDWYVPVAGIQETDPVPAGDRRTSAASWDRSTTLRSMSCHDVDFVLFDLGGVLIELGGVASF